MVVKIVGEGVGIVGDGEEVEGVVVREVRRVGEELVR